MTTLDNAIQVTILKHYLAGRDIEWIATVTHTKQDVVSAVLRDNGHPDTDRMQWAVDKLQKVEIPTRQPEPVAHTFPRKPPVTPTPAPAPVVDKPATQRADLLERASRSKSKRIQQLGEKVTELLADLAAKLKAEEDAEQATAAERERREQLVKAKADLEAKLAKVKAELAGRPTSKPQTAGAACDVCGKHIATENGMKIHRARLHTPKAA